MKAIVACIVGGLLLLVGPRLVSGNAPPASGSPVTRAALPETQPSGTVAFPEIAPSTSPSTTAAQPSTTRPQPSTSTTAAGPTTTLRPVDQDEVRHPVIQSLPYETKTWKVDYRTEGPRLVLRITLMVVLNHADQLEGRTAALKAAKTEVLAWLESRGAPPGTYGIIWQPTEAMGL